MKPYCNLVCTLALAGTFATPAFAQDAPAPLPNWQLLVITAGPEGATTGDILANGVLVQDASNADPGMSGVSVGRDSVGASTFVTVASSQGPLSLTAPGLLDDTEIVLLPKGDNGGQQTDYFLTAEGQVQLAPNERLGVLVLQTGSVFTAFQFEAPLTTAGSVSTAAYSGTGSRALIAAAGGGFGLGLGPVAVGSTNVALNFDVGIAGAFTPFGCGNCSASWETPDAREGDWYNVDLIGIGGTSAPSDPDFTFAGPAGTYQFAWSGVSINVFSTLLGPRNIAYGAYAPVGEFWPLFRTLQQP